MATAETTLPRKTNFDEIDPPSREKILDCVHCGLCAERCPTFAWDMQKFEALIPKAINVASATLTEVGV